MSKWKIQNKNAEPWSAYHTIILLGALLWNEAVYYCARLLAGSRPHYVLETPLDQWIPVLPWSVAVYFGCFLFWGVNYWLCARQSREKSERFFCADAMAKTICFLESFSAEFGLELQPTIAFVKSLSKEKIDELTMSV